ncbi:MAG: hypothetical protein ACP5LF_04610 [Nitrososphaeria archaeon]|nr:hypothetical protein [Conexivisphaerales archaeon]
MYKLEKMSIMFRSSLPLIVELSKNDPELAQASQDGGADGVLLQILTQKQNYTVSPLEDESENIRSIIERVSIKKGILLGDVRSINREELDQIKGFKFDFIAVYPATAPIFLLEAGTPLFVTVQPGLPIDYYRALSHMPSVEGFIYGPSTANRLEVSLNLVDLAVLELLTTSLSKPVYFRSPNELKADELLLLIKRGASGIIIDPFSIGAIEPSDIKETVSLYKKIIDESGYRIWM